MNSILVILTFSLLGSRRGNMEIGSACKGSCGTCRNSGGCLAGHGDDHYVRATPEELVAKQIQQEQERQRYSQYLYKRQMRKLEREARKQSAATEFNELLKRNNP